MTLLLIQCRCECKGNTNGHCSRCIWAHDLVCFLSKCQCSSCSAGLWRKASTTGHLLQPFWARSMWVVGIQPNARPCMAGQLLLLRAKTNALLPRSSLETPGCVPRAAPQGTLLLWLLNAWIWFGLSPAQALESLLDISRR